MKTKKMVKKLLLNKRTIVNMKEINMSFIQGGKIQATVYTECLSCELTRCCHTMISECCPSLITERENGFRMLLLKFNKS